MTSHGVPSLVDYVSVHTLWQAVRAPINLIGKGALTRWTKLCIFGTYRGRSIRSDGPHLAMSAGAMAIEDPYGPSGPMTLSVAWKNGGTAAATTVR